MAMRYGDIEQALVDLLTAVDYSSTFNADNRVTTVRVINEGMAAEMTLAHMPLINVRLVESYAQLTNIPNGYYEKIQYDVDIHAFDFTSFRNATTLRDGILALARTAVQKARAFHVDLETSSISSKIQFGAAAPEAGGHVASVTFTVVAEGYVDSI